MQTGGRREGWLHAWVIGNAEDHHLKFIGLAGRPAFTKTVLAVVSPTGTLRIGKAGSLVFQMASSVRSPLRFHAAYVLSRSCVVEFDTPPKE